MALTTSQQQTDHFDQIQPEQTLGTARKFRPRIFTQDSFSDHALLMSANKALEHHALPANAADLETNCSKLWYNSCFGLFGLVCGVTFSRRTTSDMSLDSSELLFPPHPTHASLSACISSLSLATCSCKLSMLTCFPPASIARGKENNARGLRALNGTFSHFNSVADTRVLVRLPKATNRLLNLMTSERVS